MNSKIVFILGAGASCEFGMPVGNQLANLISQKMRVEMDTLGNLAGAGDKSLFRHITEDEGSVTDWFGAAKRLNVGIPLRKSIDDFLDIHRDDQKLVTLGKAAIIRCILEAERSSRLYFETRHINDTIDFVSIADTWLVKLMHMLGTDDPDPQRVFNDVGFINFNYDRCLEHFLYHAVRALYALPADRAAEIVNAANILHPYGYIGSTPEFGGNIPYGSAGGIKQLVPQINTYTEASETGRVMVIHRMLREADALVFLGFGYHGPNMKLLTPERGFEEKKVFGTAKKISPEDKLVVKNRILQFFHGDAHNEVGGRMALHDLNCADLVDHYTLTWPQMENDY